MPDYKQISQLTEASSISNTDLFVVQQGSTAKKCTGLTFLAMVQAHGGVVSTTLNADYTLTFTYADGTTWTSTSIRGATGANGTNGTNGQDGDDAEILLTEYGTSSSSSTQPSSWQSSIPTVTGGNFLWTRYTWNSGDYTYQCTRYGVDGSGSGDMSKSVYSPNYTGELASKSDLSSHTGNANIHVTSSDKSTWSGKQDAITSSTALTVKTLTGGLTYLTSAPSSDNTDGIKIVVLSSTPSTKYNGYLYLITGA